MKIFLDDSECRSLLVPFTRTRHTADIRIGILTIREKWQILTNEIAEIITSTESENDFISISANIIPTKENFSQVIELAKNKKPVNETSEIRIIKYPWHIFQLNDWALRKDFELITTNRTSAPVDDSNKLINPKNIFIEETAVLSHCILNAEAGPIYIGKNARVMEGCLIRGPFSLGENSVVKMGTKIYGATTIGSDCNIGGEIKNSVVFNFSNKAHDGYLGDSVIGSWCNLGAGTSNSNVKNTAGDVYYQLDENSDPIFAGKKAGLLMGDYSRSAINTSFNTGTLIGVCCNIFENEFPKTYIPDFTWGQEKYDFQKAISHISNWKKMKNKTISDFEIETLKKLNLKN